MNRELRDLLVRAGYEPAASPDFCWQQVIVHRNIASVPVVRRAAGLGVWNHGFNLILLGENGTASHYAKCRPATVSETSHEATVLSVLGEDPALSEIIPFTRSAASATLRVQVSRFISDRAWDSDALVGNAGAWTEAVREILAVVDRVAERAAVLLPDQFDQRTIRLGDAVRPVLTYLSAVGLPSESTELLLAAVDSVPAVRPRAQHGDLWPANLIARRGGGWWVLDFEMYGRIRIPMHDVLHLMRTSTDSGGGSTWLKRLAAGNDLARAQQRIIRDAAASNEIPINAVSALAIYYLAEMTTRLHRAGTPPGFWKPYVAELYAAVEYLRKYGTLDSLLLG